MTSDSLKYRLKMIYNEAAYRLHMLKNYPEGEDEHTIRYYNKILEETKEFSELKREFSELMDFCLRREIENGRIKGKD